MKPHVYKKRGGLQKQKYGAPRKREVIFDPDARRQYLQGFSERKRQRRAYGLAMQKVKDRKSKIQEKRETKQADLERIEQAEIQKKELLREKHGVVEDELDGQAQEERTPETTTTTYQDVQTQSQFGGQVIVTTTTMPPSGAESEDESPEKVSVDSQQRYAGNVNRFLGALKVKMPAKKRRDSGGHCKHKGRHGAASMKGMGGAANLKVAQKALSKTLAKNADSKKGRGKKRRR